MRRETNHTCKIGNPRHSRPTAKSDGVRQVFCVLHRGVFLLLAMISGVFHPNVPGRSEKPRPPVSSAVPSEPVARSNGEPTRASESEYSLDLRKATTSTGLTKADLAWHASRTYGWDCDEVIEKGAMTKAEYFIITCSGGTKLRVYPRNGRHPKITNMKGDYD